MILCLYVRLSNSLACIFFFELELYFGNECQTFSIIPIPRTVGQRLHRLSRRFWRNTPITGNFYESIWLDIKSFIVKCLRLLIIKNKQGCKHDSHVLYLNTNPWHGPICGISEQIALNFLNWLLTKLNINKSMGVCRCFCLRCWNSICLKHRLNSSPLTQKPSRYPFGIVINFKIVSTW